MIADKMMMNNPKFCNKPFISMLLMFLFSCHKLKHNSPTIKIICLKFEICILFYIAQRYMVLDYIFLLSTYI